MSHSLDRDDQERWTLALKEESDFVRALPQAPESPEEELLAGTWIVLLIAVWSGPDRAAIPTAISWVAELEGAVRLGLRPFSDCRETLTWCPDVGWEEGSPVWLFMRDGRLVQHLVGLHSRESILAAARHCFQLGE